MFDPVIFATMVTRAGAQTGVGLGPPSPTYPDVIAERAQFSRVTRHNVARLSG